MFVNMLCKRKAVRMLSVIVVLVALAGFAALHSVLAAQRTKRAVTVLIGERAFWGLYRAFFNLFSVVTFIPLMLIMEYQPGALVWEARGLVGWGLLTAQVVSVMGLVWAGSQIDFRRFLGIPQARAYFNGDPLPLPPEPFVQRGMYGLVRHPLYLCLIVYLGTTQTMYAANLAFALGATIYFVVGSWLEERRLLAERGTDYLHYRARVPFLIPFVRFPPAACCMSGFTPDGS
jgi:hypothetical protein